MLRKPIKKQYRKRHPLVVRRWIYFYAESIKCKDKKPAALENEECNFYEILVSNR